MYIYIYVYIYNTGNKLVICQLQNPKSNFPKFCSFPKFMHGKIKKQI